ncbi:MAG: DNA polymerase I [Eubacteriales bacterium]|nr:DNA polymerase I [Eubacteriales bacterium]MDD4474701.1 DNA polymerase I [Eubacteriales bacterium]
MKRFIVFDGNSLLNRAYYGIRPLTTKDGLFTHAVYGFFNIINKHLSSGEKYDFAAVAFDLPGPTFRHTAFDGYKATRKGMPEELAVQLPYAKKLLPGMGIKIIESPGYEADDVLGTIASLCEKEGVLCDVVTGDRDSFQLVSPTVTVLLVTTNETKIYDVAAIKEQYGLKPEQLIDVKALMGDPSDNIPGVAGIGEKTALKLITEYGDLDNLYSHVDEVKGSVGTKLKDGKEIAYLCRDLARICRAVPIKPELEEYMLLPADKKELLELFTTLEFSKLIEKYELNKNDNIEANPTDTLPTELSAIKIVGIVGTKAAAVSIEGETVTVSLGGQVYTCPLSAEIAPLFTEPSRDICVWSYKDTAHLLEEKLEINFVSCRDDISLMGYILNPIENGYDLKRLCVQYGITEIQSEAAALSTLRAELKKQLAESAQEELYSFERKLSYVLFDMEKTGFKVDKEGLDKYCDYLAENLALAESNIYSIAGCEFNINSPKQLGDVLFEKLGLPHGKKTKTGYSTNAEVLEGLRSFSPIIDEVLQYRQLAKLKSTYAEGLAKVISPVDGRIHTTFRQTLTQTGRLSSVEPNLQNIPVRTDAGRELRKFFVADEGKVLIDADYSQIELRVLAHISGDEALINAFRDNEDIHTITASQVFGVSPQMVTSEMRKSAKAVNFGIVYGISDYSLSVDIGVTKKEAGDYIGGYFAKYPKVREYMDRTIENAKRDGYVETLMGRRRYIPELHSAKKPLIRFGERVAMNTPIQGTAADIIKKAMVDVYDALAEGNYKSKLILQVHDELLIEAPEEEADEVYKMLIKRMENAFPLSVPLDVDAHVGKSWYDAKG